MLHPHRKEPGDHAREQRHRQHVVANVTSDRAEQRDYQEVARPWARRTCGLRLSRATHQGADRKREQKSKRGRIRAVRLGHRACDVSAMSAEMLAQEVQTAAPRIEVRDLIRLRRSPNAIGVFTIGWKISLITGG